MNRDKQIEEMAKITCLCNAGGFCEYDGKPCDLDCSEGKAMARLYNAGYRKSTDVARETAYDFQNRLRHIFLNMCKYNDYNTLNLLQIDNAIEALYDTFIAELKKKYTESEDTE